MKIYFAKIKKYYCENLYSDEDLDIFVEANFISEEQKQEILKSKNDIKSSSIVRREKYE